MKKIILTTGLILNALCLFAFEAVPTSELLLSYLQNDTNLKNQTIETQKAQLSLESSQISNGFDISLSTGNFTIKAENGGTSISVKPSVEASIPQASNLSVTASTEYNYSSSASTSEFENIKLNASVDIIGTQTLQRKITLLKAERTLTEAKRKLTNQALNSEKQFYTELKSLLNSTNSIISQEKTLYTNKIDLNKYAAQGYSKNSSTYRLAQMKVVDSEYELAKAKRSLIHDYVVFYKDCGLDITLEDSIDVYTLIPSDIQEVEPLNIEDFDQTLYSEVETAEWNHKISSMERDTFKIFGLSANGGMTFNNSTTNSNTLDAGLTAKYSGINLTAGINVPLESGNTPAFTLSASVSPNTFRQNKITQQQYDLNEQQELLTIATAEKNYETTKLDYQQQLSDLKWEKQSNQESYELYASVEKDLASYYKAGIITESEYYTARVNTQSAKVNKVINAIDFIIYNDELTTLFVPAEKESEESQD